MIRWREQTDCYRLEFAFSEVARLWTFFIALVLIAGGGLVREFRSASLSDALALAVGLIGIVGVAVYLDNRFLLPRIGLRIGAWIEVSVRGGQARWESLDGNGLPIFMEVSRFEVVHDARGRAGIAAALRKGPTVRVVDPCRLLQFSIAEKLVRDLNACLETIEASAATLDVVPGGVNLDPNQPSRYSRDPWGGQSPPYRVRFRRMDLVILGAFVPAVVALALWQVFPISPNALSSWVIAVLGLCAVALPCWYLREGFWIEVGEKGGCVRWGYRAEEWSRLPVVVAGFAVGRDLSPQNERSHRYFPVAILPDGSDLKPLRDYRTRWRDTVYSCVVALNAALARSRR